MGNCGGTPQTNEGEDVPVPAPVVDEVMMKVEQQQILHENAAPTHPQDLPLSAQNDEGTNVEVAKSEEEDANPETKQENKA
ncbi:hypothetical protein Lal_00044133 [Lupinus albus]|nr:hypothetical protein Lal_00044133 [Lupinus albus]